MQREEGFYWVKCNEHFEVAAWFDGAWSLSATAVTLSDSQMRWIGERIPEPMGEAA
ncbi:hypothetical protein [Hyphomicrobium sp. ghe19]|uniref:hypothetical protein n=1 Tax=Hyphomicrobium sp. ghe19 TaxID=2682968 RepID=UPI001367979F|nr:hypothetical protein HYPP_00102 [Hyphomicrobium sp. ghe19]